MDVVQIVLPALLLIGVQCSSEGSKGPVGGETDDKTGPEGGEIDDKTGKFTYHCLITKLGLAEQNLIQIPSPS